MLQVTSRLSMRRDPCIACGLPVFLAEKLVVAHVAYHRTCFRCARCNNQLTLGNYYETEEGQFCCETCPDEDASSSAIQQLNEATVLSETSEKNDIVTDSSYQESFSDEEDTDGRVLSHNSIKSLELENSSVLDVVAQTSRLRLNFISNHLLSEEDNETRVVIDSPVNDDLQTTNRIDSVFSVVNDKYDQRNKIEKEYNSAIAYSKPESQCNENTIEEACGDSMETNDHVHDNVNSNAREEEHKLTNTTIRAVLKDKSVNLVTKINNTKELLDHSDEREDADNCLSLVQRRLKLFESQDKVDHAERKRNEQQSVEVLDSKTQNKQHIEIVNNSHKNSIIDLQKSNVKNNTINSAAESSLSWNRTNSGKSSSKINEAADNEASSLPSSIKNFDAESDKKHANTVAIPEVSSSLFKKMTEPSMPVEINKESIEDNAFVAVEKETSQIHVSNANPRIKKDYPEDLNPFKSDDDEDIDKGQTKVDSFEGTRNLTNPFDSEESVEQEEDKTKKVVPPTPTTRSNFNNNKHKQQLLISKRLLAAPKINLNSFSSDEDDHGMDLESQEERLKNVPVPKPRNLSILSTSNGSLTSLESGVTLGATPRKKKPAPLPPNMKELCPSNQRTSVTLQSHNNSSDNHDPCLRTTIKRHKTKPAPPPPMRSSSPCNTSIAATLNFDESPIVQSRNMDQYQNTSDDKKTNKDEENRSKQSLMHIPCGDNFDYKSFLDKSTQGKWKRKKGPAPTCPMLHKRKVKIMSLKDVKLELDEIELQQQGLEKQGVRLEQLIRNKCESGPSTDDVFPGTDVEELVLELFALVNEKNELFRRQAELMLLRRQQRLEEEHVEVEYQIRCLMSQHESTKTDFDKQKEEVLIQRLVEIVERRNEIVECLEMDRRREIEEDRSIHKHMDLFAAKKKNETSSNEIDDPCCSKMKKGKTKKKTKEKKSNKTSKKDVDKDIDETELTLKRHNKRKWF
ncbi:MICAL-like protein isoform X2 [Ptiloglossa arizonensis]|uniref:MICAL-like protein isoform X2 n=1 Tax=Ptiloglossa arizonensis TaxID=3350558 RepID=UPI003F9F17AE